MSENGENHAATDPTDMIASFWTRWMEQSSRGTQAMLDALQSTGDSQLLQRRWLNAVSESLESFFRTPAFQEAMKQHLKVMTDLKGMQDQLIHGTARQFGIPLADDIAGLFERLNSVEKKILSRIGEVETRVKTLEEKI